MQNNNNITEFQMSLKQYSLAMALYKDHKAPVRDIDEVGWIIDIAICERIWGANWKAILLNMAMTDTGLVSLNLTEVLRRKRIWLEQAVKVAYEYVVSGQFDKTQEKYSRDFMANRALKHHQILDSVLHNSTWRKGENNDEVLDKIVHGVTAFQIIFVPEGAYVTTVAGQTVHLFAILTINSVTPATVSYQNL